MDARTDGWIDGLMDQWMYGMHPVCLLPLGTILYPYSLNATHTRLRKHVQIQTAQLLTSIYLLNIPEHPKESHKAGRSYNWISPSFKELIQNKPRNFQNVYMCICSDTFASGSLTDVVDDGATRTCRGWWILGYGWTVFSISLG